MVSRKGLFNIGDKIEIVREETKDTKFYPSQILDITRKNTYIISGPIYKNKIVPLHINEIIGVSRLIENKGRYLFDAKVIMRNHGRIYKLELERISNIIKYQQRDFFRFEVAIPVIKKMELKTKEGEEILSEVCKTKDISGSGMKLLSNFEHKVGDKVSCEFKIDNNPIKVNSEIVRIDDIDTFDYDYSLGIKYLDITEMDRDIIIKFIFEKQRLLREKGLI